ncbi:unnamed protein product, partial [Ixodes pacificus]
VDGKLQLGLLAVVHGQALHEEGGEARASAAPEAVEDEETLQARALVCQLPDPVQHQVHNLLANRVVAPGIVVGRILLARDQLLRVEQLPAGAGGQPSSQEDSGLQVHVDSPGYMLAGPSLAEKGVEGVVAPADGLVAGHLPIRLDAVLQAVELPAGIANLHACLAHVD